MTDELVTKDVAANEDEVTKDDRAVDNDSVMIGGKSHKLKRMNAKQVAKLSNVIGRALMAGTLKMKELRDAKAINDATLVMSVLAALDDKMLVTFASALVNIDEAIVEQEFDLTWVIDALVKQIRISNINGIIQNFTSLSSQIQ